MYKQILAAVDGSSTSDVALHQALEFTANTRARLRIVHVIDSPYDYPDTIYGFVPGDLEELREAWRKMRPAILDHALEAARKTGVTPESALLEIAGRRVSTTIVDEAQHWAADLIVVGTHGRRGLDRLLLGSVAEGVSGSAPVSVLLVRGAGSEEQT